MSKEQWKDVVGYEGLYRVSDRGRIKSLQYQGVSREKILKPWKNKNGNGIRLMISLHKNGIKSRFYVHQLILKTFIGPCPNNMECCHNDGNSENNLTNNLRWDTHQSNMRDMMDDGNHWFSNNPNEFRGSKNGMSKIKEEQIIQIIKYVNDGIPQHQIAQKFNVSQATISAIEKRRLWKHLTENLPISNRVNKGSSKLTATDLKQIRTLIRENTTLVQIAEQFGVSYNTINRIRKNQTNRER